ncbi:hypothetical protein BC832DRAFT_476613 [Gaertneriomyces semiglobifer]|nr:hypothetical protein BC832DRAFT_476613 [Gaertneriomyces semiglobifer]
MVSVISKTVSRSQWVWRKRKAAIPARNCDQGSHIFDVCSSPDSISTGGLHIAHAGVYHYQVTSPRSSDAKLVAPTQDPSTPEKTYSHIATFSRFAPVPQQLALWSEAASVLLDEYKSDANKTFWLSTSGLRVPWLHPRIDTRPKHIHWVPYTYL